MHTESNNHRAGLGRIDNQLGELLIELNGYEFTPWDGGYLECAGLAAEFVPIPFGETKIGHVEFNLLPSGDYPPLNISLARKGAQREIRREVMRTKPGAAILRYLLLDHPVKVEIAAVTGPSRTVVPRGQFDYLPPRGMVLAGLKKSTSLLTENKEGYAFGADSAVDDKTLYPLAHFHDENFLVTVAKDQAGGLWLLAFTPKAEFEGAQIAFESGLTRGSFPIKGGPGRFKGQCRLDLTEADLKAFNPRFWIEPGPLEG
jgi:hypothetical protein